MPDKVTDVNKMVTDAHVLSTLAEQGIDKDYVELYEDYSGKHPSTKIYRDRKSDKHIAVIQALPKVNKSGVKICGNSPGETTVGWTKHGNTFTSTPNMFEVSVKKTAVTINLDGKTLKFSPQLYLESKETHCNQNPDLIDDPTNPHYYRNVLEWDYGFCKRRLRLIEGAVLGSWVFDANPEKEVRIKYNQSGDFRLRLGQYKVSDDEEIVPSVLEG